MEIEEDFLENHQSKCRCCFKQFGKSEKPIKITKTIETQFFDLTQLKLKSSAKKYSQNICETCNSNLDGFSKVRTDFLMKQKQLYDLVDGRTSRSTRKFKQQSQELENFPLKVEIKQEHVDFEEEQCIIIEPFVKTEKIKDDEESNDFQPLEHLYESDDDVKVEKDQSDSSVGPFDDFFSSKKHSQKKKYKKRQNKHQSSQNKSKSDKIWHHCPHCDKKFSYETTLKVHIDAYHFNFKNFQCDKCDFKTRTPNLLKGHIARVHDRTQIIPSAKDQPKTSCPICGLLVQKVSAHIRNVHTRPKNVFCDICGFGIFNLNRLRRHMYKHLSKETKRVLMAYTCDLCGAELHSKNSIKSHMKNIHLQTGVREYKCFCGKAYKAESYLKIHMKSHERTAKHPCPICDKKFVNPSQVKIHMEIHERKGRKDYSCEVCGGMYGSMNLLMRHKIFHTDPKFGCQYCPKKFHRPSLLDRHVKRAHEVEETPCQFCGKMLNVLSMTRHVKEFHSGLPRLNCPIPGCNGTYLRRFHLKDHLQRSHKDYMNFLTAEEKNALDEKINQMNLI